MDNEQKISPLHSDIRSNDPNEEEWGEYAMLEELKLITEKPAEEILHHIVAAADLFANGAKQHDDMTMIIVRLLAAMERQAG